MMYQRKLLLLAAMASLATLYMLPVLAKSVPVSGDHAPATGVSNFLEPVSRPEAIALLTGNEFSVASASPGGWPDPVGDHFHSDDSDTYGTGTDWIEVGECCADGNDEEARGMVEFNIVGAFVAQSAMVEVQVAQLGGLFGQSGPGSFTIDVYAYEGNNTEQIVDYSAEATYLTSFESAGLLVSQVLQFDVTDVFNAAVGDSDPSLGIRFQPASEPGEQAVVFGNATLTFSTDPPLPPVESTPVPSSSVTGLLLLLLATLGIGLVFMRARSG